VIVEGFNSSPVRLLVVLSDTVDRQVFQQEEGNVHGVVRRGRNRVFVASSSAVTVIMKSDSRRAKAWRGVRISCSNMCEASILKSEFESGNSEDEKTSKPKDSSLC
jgi:hypothetical protein